LKLFFSFFLFSDFGFPVDQFARTCCAISTTRLVFEKESICFTQLLQTGVSFFGKTAITTKSLLLSLLGLGAELEKICLAVFVNGQYRKGGY